LQAIRDFKALSPFKRHIAVGLLFTSLGLITAAQYDIHSRAKDQVRGPKLFWRLVSLNALGAVGYFRWGRASRAAAQPPSR
jgi:hypothetical protein